MADNPDLLEAEMTNRATHHFGQPMNDATMLAVIHSVATQAGIVMSSEAAKSLVRVAL